MIRIESRSLSPRPLPIGAASGMTVAQPTSSSFFGQHGIREDVRQDREAVLDERRRRAQRLDRIGQEVARVRDDLELDPVRQAAGPGEPRGPDRLVGGLAARGVREKEHLLRQERR